MQSRWTMSKLYKKNLQLNNDFLIYDCSALWAARRTATDLLNSHAAMSTPLPSSLPPNKRVQQPSASFKPPKLIIENWSIQTYDFYTWLSSFLHGFNLAQCDNPGKLHHTLHAIPLNKRGPLNHINDWDTFRVSLIEEVGSINVFGREVNQLFDVLPPYESVQEVAEDLAPKINTLQSNLKTMGQFQKLEHLRSVAITQSLNQNIMKSLPLEVRSSFNDQFTLFQEQSPDNILAPNTFSFLAQFDNKLKKNYQSNPNVSAFEADVPDVLKTIQPPFSYCQADIFEPIFAHQVGRQLKRWCSCFALSLKSRGALGNPPQLQHHQRFQKDLCSEGHPTYHLDWHWVEHCEGRQGLDQHGNEGYLQPQLKVWVHQIQSNPPQAPRRGRSGGE